MLYRLSQNSTNYPISIGSKVEPIVLYYYDNNSITINLGSLL